MLNIKFTLLIFILASSCHLHKVKDNKYEQNFLLESNFSLKQSSPTQQDKLWYKNFKNTELDQLIEESLKNNFDLKKAWSKLQQAQLKSQLAGADLRPQISINGSQNLRNIDNNESQNASLQAILQWELDLWKVAQNLKSIELAKFRIDEAIYQNTALILSAAIANNYFDLQNKFAINDLLEIRLKNRQIIYDYVAKRKAITGVGTLIDYQGAESAYLLQKDNIAKNQQEISLLQQSLAILLGKSPISYKFKPKKKLQELPAIPQLPTPEILIQNNNILKEKWQEIRQQDYNIAVQYASKFPRLTINSSYAISNDNLNFSVSDFIFNLSVNFIKNIYDGGKQKLNHKISKEEFTEVLHEFNQTYLEILQDVEQALAVEKYLVQSTEVQKRRDKLADNNLQEVKKLYSNGGGINFESILATVGSTMDRKIDLQNTQNNLLKSRVALHLALGNNIILKKDN